MSVPTGRLGDSMTHGATLVSGSADRLVNNIPVCRLGDVVSCPIHGINQIVSVNTTTYTDNKNTVIIGAVAACGAVVITGSPNVLTG